MTREKVEFTTSDVTHTPHHTNSSVGFTRAKRVDRVRKSCVREILAGGNKNLISFAGGFPDTGHIPADLIVQAAQNVLSSYGKNALQYGPSEGEPELRAFIADYWLRRQGIKASPEDLIIVNGSQQALDLLAKVLIDEGAPFAVERPTYLAALQAFELFAPLFKEVSLDEEGADPAELDHCLERGAKAFYAIPSFQNPSGTCYSKQRREELAEVLARRMGLLIEDDPYSELYYESPPPAPISSVLGGRSVLLGTFSKVLSPAFRIGWIYAPRDLRRHLITVKQAADLCGSRLQQLVVWELLKALDLPEHLARIRSQYKAKRDSFQGALCETIGDRIEWDAPKGGMFFWVRLKGNLDGRELLKQGLKRGVGFADGDSFFAVPSGSSYLRLNFTNPTSEEVRLGLRRLADLVASVQEAS